MKSSPVDIFGCLRCLNDDIDLPQMIGSLASGANASLVAKKGTKIFFQMSLFLIAISWYLEAEIDYKSFILFVVFQDNAQ